MRVKPAFSLNTPMMAQQRMFGTGPLYSGTVVAPMHYQKVIPGKQIGRYID
jgi:hypothetical protein